MSRRPTAAPPLASNREQGRDDTHMPRSHFFSMTFPLLFKPNPNFSSPQHAHMRAGAANTHCSMECDRGNSDAQTPMAMRKAKKLGQWRCVTSKLGRHV